MDFKFYTFKLEVDGNTKTYKVFEDKTDKLLFTGKTTDINKNCNLLQLGDGSSQIYGSVDPAYFGYTLQ